MKSSLVLGKCARGGKDLKTSGFSLEVSYREEAKIGSEHFSILLKDEEKKK